MRKAAKIDMPEVTDLIVKMFDQNPGVNWLIKPGASKSRNSKTGRIRLHQMPEQEWCLSFF